MIINEKKHLVPSLTPSNYTCSHEGDFFATISPINYSLISNSEKVSLNFEVHPYSLKIYGQHSNESSTYQPHQSPFTLLHLPIYQFNPKDCQHSSSTSLDGFDSKIFIRQKFHFLLFYEPAICL